MRNCSKTAQELPKCLLLILHTFAWEFSVDPALHRIYAHIRYIRPQEHTEWNEICDFRCSTVCDQVCDIYPPHAKDLRPEEQWCGFSPFPSTSEWIFHAQTWNHEIIMSKMHWDWNPVKVSMEKCTLFSLRISVKYEAIDPVLIWTSDSQPANAKSDSDCQSYIFVPGEPGESRFREEISRKEGKKLSF